VSDSEALDGDPLTHNTQKNSAQGRQESGRLAPKIGVGIGVVVLAAAALGGSMLVFRQAGDAPVAPSSAAHHATTTASGPTVMPKVVDTLAEGEQPPSSFGADPKRRGVWFVTGNEVTESIDFVGVDPDQSRVFPLPTHYSIGSSVGIAVASDGTVWAGIDLVLIHLNPTTGAMTTYPVPTPSNGFRAITAIAVTGSDTVALAIYDTDQVVVFRDGRFVDWSLPTNTEPWDVAYLKDGTLGVSLSDLNTHTYDRVVTYTPSGARSESQLVDVYHLASTGTQFVSVENQIVVFNASAQLTATLQFVPTLKPKVLIISPISVLPNGDLLLRSGDGVLVSSLTTGATVVLQLPRAACPNPISFSVPPPSHPAGYLCEQIPNLVASDGEGDLWMLLGTPLQVDVVEGFGTS
jgi:hypothetical protein